MTAPISLASGAPRPLFTKYIQLTVTDAVGDDHEFACYTTQSGLVSEGGDVQTIVTLCPDGSFSETTERTWSLQLTGVQDVETANSLMLFLFDHDGEDASFTFYPKVTRTGSPQGRGWTGGVKLTSPDTIGGGDAGNYATFSSSFPLTGKPVMIDGAGTIISGALPDPQGADKAAAAPGDVYPAEPTVTASDSANAAKLTNLGYVAAPQTAWLTGQKINIGTYAFNWSGTA